MSPTETMDYDSMTVLKLKTLCKERCLRVSGNKSEVIIRLMENDEVGLAPAPTPIQQQTFPQHNPGGYIPPQMIYVKKESELATGIGICIMIYAVFRLFWAVIFSVGGLGGVGWVLSPVAFILGIGFMIRPSQYSFRSSGERESDYCNTSITIGIVPCYVVGILIWVYICKWGSGDAKIETCRQFKRTRVELEGCLRW